MTTVFFVGAFSGQGHAMKFGTSGDGISGGLDVTATYSNMYRVEGRDSSSAILEEEINMDDGDRNFDKGLVSNMFKLLGEFELRNDTPEYTLGLFARGYTLHDTEIFDRGSDHDSAWRNNSGSLYDGSLSPDDKGFTPDAEDEIGQKTELLDAFIFTEQFKQTDHPLTIKLGQQVVNWGESLFIQSGIVNAINPADVTRAAIPGTEIKEILLPTKQAFASIAVTPNLSLSGYYQFEHDYTNAPPPGSYFSTNDFIGEGSEKILLDIFDGLTPIPSPPDRPQISTLDRGATRKADDDGQYGIALNYLSEALNYTDFGLYFVNYHSKLPGLGFESSLNGIADSPDFNPMMKQSNGGPIPDVAAPWAADTSYFFHEYFEDVQLIGASFNTTLPSFSIFDTAFSGEVAYHHDVPVQTAPYDEGLKSMMNFGGPMPIMLPGQEVHLFTKEDLITAQVTFNQKINAPKLADDITFLSEFGLVYAPDLDDGDSASFDINNRDQVWRGKETADNFAWGYKMKLMATHFDALSGISKSLSGTDVTTTISWNHDVDGVSAIAAGSFNEGARSLGIGVNALWQNTWSAGVAYNMFFWDDRELTLGDRDNVSFVFKRFF